MLRVLQLIDRDAGFQNRTAAEQLGRGMGAEFQIALETVHPGMPGILDSYRRIRHALNFDLVHAFGSAALTVACINGGKIIYTPEAPSARAARWLRAIAGHRDIHIVCPTDTMRRYFVERGVPIERCLLIRPGVEFGKIKGRRNDILRGSLGLMPSDHVMLAAGESTRAGNHRLAVWAGSILHVLDSKHRLLLWGKGHMSDSVIRFANRLKRPGYLTVARHLSIEELLPAADTVLITPEGPSETLPIAICMAAGLPIIATVTPTVAELLEDRHTALLTTKPQPRLIAQRILDLLADAKLRWSIADMARTEAFEYFSLTRFLDQHRALYRQFAANERIEIPQPQPGAGLRFHGRAS
jgi:glycosyltransferase involved in cell wall biosynthesis